MCYYDEIVWNRAARFDAVFGSSNSSKGLPDWLAVVLFASFSHSNNNGLSKWAHAPDY
jgi:hypothetical protein